VTSSSSASGKTGNQKEVAVRLSLLKVVVYVLFFKILFFIILHNQKKVAVLLFLF
jgi:hypothetical protein